MNTSIGSPTPLGVNLDDTGANFAIFSENATSVELLLFDSENAEPKARVQLTKSSNVWHIHVQGIHPGQMYAFSIDGPYEPNRGARFNRHKALIDPYAKSIIGETDWNELLSGFDPKDLKLDVSFDERDSSRIIPKSVVTDTKYDWEKDKRPSIPWENTILYEMHVKGFTKLNHEIEPSERGTFEGLSSPVVINYLKGLGVTTVELLPVQQHFDEWFLAKKGLRNYWGYNTIGFFAPENQYARVFGNQVIEFKDMVRSLHKAGIEVILDVVYNHTAEGDQLGPTICFRGIDNPTYYRLDKDRQMFYDNFTGTGNTLNLSNPHTLQLVIDSLRYWINEMHIDGFRFDLAAALARDNRGFNRFSEFLKQVESDPDISKVKLIAEPWDAGDDGYQLGQFPTGWSEWNGAYRDFVRKFWRGEEFSIKEIAFRLAGSPDIFGGRPYGSVNYATCHDGFTLEDLVSYEQKHNEANLEGTKDGTDQNFSWNCGIEGETNDQKIIDLREKQKRNILATVLLSRGIPMILGGDELGRSQRGNNNAYCQDNEVSWVDWKPSDRKRSLLGFTRRLIDLRKEHPILRHGIALANRPFEAQDNIWLLPHKRVTEQDWNETKTRTIGVILKGEKLQDDTFLLLLNTSPDSVSFAIPRLSEDWEVVVQTPESKELRIHGGSDYNLTGRALVLMRTV